MRLSVIIPFHRDLRQLEASLAAVRRTVPDAEVVISADAATEDCRPLVTRFDARLVEVPGSPGPSGPAVARNRGAAAATGDILAFVDADVVVAPGALDGLCRVLAGEPDLAAVFGAYDLLPADPGFMSRYKNLSHAYVHETGNPDAATFWAGLGAVRADRFRAVAGFDERFRRPSVEDINLGYRLRQRGGRLRLDPRFRGQHLKRWTLRGSVRTDVIARGIPWAQLIRKYGAMRNDLNLRRELRLSVVAAYLCLASLAASIVMPWMLGVTVAALAAIWVLNARYYRWFARVRGAWFAARVFPAHVLHHLSNGVSFVAGNALALAGRAGLSVPGVIPATVWGASGTSPALAAAPSSAPLD